MNFIPTYTILSQNYPLAIRSTFQKKMECGVPPQSYRSTSFFWLPLESETMVLGIKSFQL